MENQLFKDLEACIKFANKFNTLSKDKDKSDKLLGNHKIADIKFEISGGDTEDFFNKKVFDVVFDDEKGSLHLVSEGDKMLAMLARKLVKKYKKALKNM